MSAIEKALLKGRGRDEGLKYKLRKLYRNKNSQVNNSDFRQTEALVTQEKQDAYLSRTIDWEGRRANRVKKARIKARRFLIQEKRKNGHQAVVVTPEFFPSPENIKKYLISQKK